MLELVFVRERDDAFDISESSCKGDLKDSIITKVTMEDLLEKWSKYKARNLDGMDSCNEKQV